MDNIKTGYLIRELRLEKGMTQKDLADLLHITDKAVSKWERGLCAPDISLLEPLSEALGVSIVELIEGERITRNEYFKDMEANSRTVLDYSKKVIRNKVSNTRTKYLGVTAACMIIVILICSLTLWQGGYFFIIDKISSPDDAFSITVYNKTLAGIGFSGEDATSIIMRAKNKDRGDWRVSYRNSVYQGIWWAPDSKKYVVAIKYPDSEYLALAWLERNSESNLSANLPMSIGMNEVIDYETQYDDDKLLPEIKYQFLQWSSDSTSMLIYYSFVDGNQLTHSGYFWYNCENGTVNAQFEQ